MTKQDKHKLEVDKLNSIEKELTRMIAQTNNEQLMDKFLDWQNKRTECNKLYIENLADACK